MANLPYLPKSILITGASSGIGTALASEYAAPGIRLVLFGRHPGRLAEVARQCMAQGAEVSVHAIDVRDQAKMAAAIETENARTPLDLVIANAGVAKNQEDAEFARELVEINVVGVLNTVEPALQCMVARKAGQVLILSSLAAFRAFGGPPGYAGSKAWARLYGEALRGRMASKGISVCVACPGFVRTPMTAASAKGGMPATEAAHLIRIGLEHNKPRISFPRTMAFRAWLNNALPIWWTDRTIQKKWRAARAGEVR
jgi:NADP-dependent 3-hydroxy acid dehydrogenase YdfG